MEGVIVVLLTMSVTTVLGYPGVILQHPETQTTLAGGSKIFVCTGQGDVLWYINNLWLSNSYRETLTEEGFVFTKTVLSGYTYPTANLTMSIPARNDLNGTEVHCRTAGSDTNIVYSNYSYLWIVGPPLTPNVSVELTSWNTIRLSWTAPFTADEFPILRYIVLSTNSSTGQRSRTDVYPTDGNESLSIVDTPSNCHSLQFEILAHNSAGNSSSHLVSIGFPIAVNEFKVNMSTVYLIEQDKINVLLSFQPPEVCSGNTGVSATYILELMTVSGVVVHRTETQYHDSNIIEETLTVDSCTFYYLNVSVFVPSFPELGTRSNISHVNVTFVCKPTTEPTTGPTTGPTTKPTNEPTTGPTTGPVTKPTTGSTTGPTTEPPTGPTTGPTTEQTTGPVTGSSSKGSQSSVPQWVLLVIVLAVLLLVILVGGGLAVVCLQQRKRKTVNMRTTATTARRSLPPMENNPIYGDHNVHPVYDVIPEGQIKSAEAKPLPPLRKQVSCDFRYSPTPKSLPLENNGRQRSVSVCQSPFTPETPSPRDVDALIHNNAGRSSSSFNKRFTDGRGGGKMGEEEVYDKLCKKLPTWKEMKSEDNDTERDDCYVLMQSNV